MIRQNKRFPVTALATYACILVMLASAALAKPKQHIPGSNNHHNTAGMNSSGAAIGLYKNSSLNFNCGSTASPSGAAKNNGPKFSTMSSGGMGTCKSNASGQATKPSCTGPASSSPYTPKMVSNGIMVKTHPGKNLGYFGQGLAGQNNGKGKLVLGAGDAFSAACDFGDISGSMEVPNPIGAKGPNPTHGGQHPKKGLGNPGGGKGKGHWGEGNHGNGKGNIWTGNQGNGVGEGMAGGRCSNGGDDPGGDDPGGDDPSGDDPGNDDREDLFEAADAAPLFNKPELEFSGCPALLQWTANELGVPEGQLQIYMKNTLASPTDIQPCAVCAQLQTAALILKDIQGRRVSALTAVIAEAVTLDAPITPEQMAVIAKVLAEAEKGSQYASAAEYIGAALSYINILTSEFGFTMEDSLELVSKYVVTIEDEAVANYVLARLVQL